MKTLALLAALAILPHAPTEEPLQSSEPFVVTPLAPMPAEPDMKALASLNTCELRPGEDAPFEVRDHERLDHNTIWIQQIAHATEPAQELQMVPFDFVGPLAPHQRTPMEYALDRYLGDPLNHITTNSPIVFGGPYNDRTLAFTPGNVTIYGGPYNDRTLAHSKTAHALEQLLGPHGLLELTIPEFNEVFPRDLSFTDSPEPTAGPTLAPDDDPSPDN